MFLKMRENCVLHTPSYVLGRQNLKHQGAGDGKGGHHVTPHLVILPPVTQRRGHQCQTSGNPATLSLRIGV